jgi:two-component sensor histidine kinase
VLVNELVMNAFNCAYPGASGEVRVKLNAAGSRHAFGSDGRPGRLASRFRRRDPDQFQNETSRHVESTAWGESLTGELKGAGTQFELVFPAVHMMSSRSALKAR